MTVFSELLENKINITQSMYDKADRIYEDVCNTLQENLNLYDPDIFIQGSFKLKTVIKPVDKEEQYDLDIVCHLKFDKNKMSQGRLKELVGNALRKRYRTVEQKKRCWRIVQDNFHIDILPAIPAESSLYSYILSKNSHLIDRPILIPDKELKTWTPSHPRGYAKWFEDQGNKKAPHKRSLLTENSQEPLRNPNNKVSVLQNTVKIMKYYRDIQFINNPDDKPISVILTTLAAKYYNGEQTIEEALSNITKRIIGDAQEIFVEGCISNPVLPEENFADKWAKEPNLKEAFKKWVKSLDKFMQDYNLYKNDSTQVNRMFNESFGYNIATNYAQNLGKQLSAGLLGLGAGGNIEANAAGKPTKFYGDE